MTHLISWPKPPDLDTWRDAVRPWLAARIPPQNLQWQVGDQATDLFANPASEQSPLPAATHPVRLTRPQMNMCERVLCHRDSQRFGGLYATILRLQSDPHAMDDPADPNIIWVREADKAIRRDVHKMHAFVRFRKVGERLSGNMTREIFVAWFEPEHRIVNITAGFFQRRFTGMDWSILTPDGCSHWDGETLRRSGPARREDAPSADASEAAWKTYYASIFNPSRVKIGAMMAEMPKKYWKNLPEAELIPQLIQQSENRQRGFLGAAETLPNIRTDRVSPMVFAQTSSPAQISTLHDAKAAAARCQDCALGCAATQTVFGEGPATARLMVVGEQPGDAEDIAGRPFVGPAGQTLNQALKDADVGRESIYLTNAVKHFKFRVREKRRLHMSPAVQEMLACQQWLETEISLVKPSVILTLGRSALRSVAGHRGSLSDVRGQILRRGTTAVIPTIHPSYLLRLPDPQQIAREYAQFVADIRHAQALAAAGEFVETDG